MPLYVHRSNRMEHLAARLAEVVCTPAAGARPVDPECIVVQGRGMERWLSMRLAEHFGVWANPAFPFPRRVIRRAIESVVGGEKEGEAFEPETLTWVIAALVPTLVERSGFEPIAGYLRSDPRGLRAIGLAARLADTFDQYAVFRSDMIRGWERGGDREDWQAVLWREVVKRHGRRHIAAEIGELVRKIDDGRGPIPRFPARLSVFGISALPPLYVDCLVALGRRIDVHLFVLSPSAYYWADVRSRREIVRALLRDGRELDEDALHLECGNPLLASLGRLGRDFQGVLEGAGDYHEPAPDLYEDPGQRTMLATLQSDIFALRHRSKASGDAAPIAIDEADGSVAVHACHGPMREVEVLHDQLLDLFERHPDIEPRDVVVMSPAIDEYAPYVDAVFGRPALSGRAKIPYHVADRAVGATEEVVDAFERLLDVLRGRMEAAEVLDLLAVEPIRDRFAIGAAALDVLRAWTGAAGIRWGIDAEHRLAECGTEVDANTWRFGLDRLLLGHAMRADGRVLFAGVSPFDGAEGGEELLGPFVDFCQTLFSFRGTLEAPRTLRRWGNDLGVLLEGMVAVTRLNRDQHRRVRRALETLAERAAIAGFGEPVSLDVVRAEMKRDFARETSSGAFLSRGVTFCAFVPMRSIPFRVVCLLGMNDGAFPRRRRPLGFDRLAEARRPGDRSQRDDDRYLFLEAILSARDRLLVTYVGHGIHDNAVYPPSVVVSELLDALEESFRVPNGTVHERVVVHHPLQPFSRRYFEKGGDPRLFSYDPAYSEGAERLGGSRVERPPFLRRPLARDPAAERAVSVDDLGRFFENPARSFVRRRLGLVIDDELADVDFRDPLEPDALETWKLTSEIVACELGNEDLPRSLAALGAGGRLPHGTPGRILLDRLRETAQRIAAEVRAVTNGERLQPIVLDETIGDTRLGGVLRKLSPGVHIWYSPSKITAKHEIGPWIRHLALCLRTEPGRPRLTRLVGRKNGDSCTIVFDEVAPDSARAILGKLIGLYWLGQTVPLPFFANSARAYLKALERNPEDRAIAKARQQFVGGGRSEPAECNDPHAKLVFGGIDPLARRFRPAAEAADDVPWFGALAAEILGDLSAYRREE